jgi:hypothetical protein
VCNQVLQTPVGELRTKPGRVASTARSGQRRRVTLISGYLPYAVKPSCGHFSCEKCHSLQKNLRLRSLSPPVHGRNSALCQPETATGTCQVFGSQRVPLRGESRPTGRIFASETAPCTNSCRKKNPENRLRSRYTLAAPLGSCVDQIHAPPSSFCVFRMKSARAFASREEVFRRRRDKCVYTDLQTVTAIRTQPPGRQQYGRSRRCP